MANVLACGIGIALIASVASADFGAQAELGRALFFDANLSRARTQSCAQCHDPARGFSDARDNGVGGAASRGGDGKSIHVRNTPGIAYAAYVPSFARAADGEYVGGLFHDGRARDLEEQAGQPILNPLEMALPDVASVVERMRENPTYVRAFAAVHDAPVLDDDAQGFAAVRSALAAFQRTSFFATFDSRYDRYLAGEVALTELEDAGRTFFFSSLTNCASCHVEERAALGARQLFTNFRYFNLGLPVNHALNRAAGVGAPDPGLAASPGVTAPAQRGRFRVPSLRNVAVTAPYMHNGVFRELRTAVAFYNRYLVRNPNSHVNPETGAAWGDTEWPATVAHDLLRQGQPLTEARIDAIVAFLRALTDRRYEHLLE